MGTVTLVTGDRVTVRRVGQRLLPEVDRGPGRAAIHFLTRQYDDRLLVVPSDAEPLLAAGRLDERLFDVAGLLRQGYGDTHRSDLPVMVQGARAGDQVRQGGALLRATLPAVGAVAARQPKRTAGTFWRRLVPRPGTAKVWLDARRPLTLDRTVPQIGAPAAWQAGYTGKGVKVAVLDSGIDPQHGDFKDKLAVVKDFTGTLPADDVGHGTHVASIIAGTGVRSGGRYRGAAPDANLMIGKVCTAQGCTESAIVAAMTWAATNGARIVNLSLGGADTPETDLLEQSVNSLSEKYGILFVVAAGNEGSYGDETIGSPASADAALAVGAVDRSDVLADFSSRGPRFGDAALKPEITAPGVGVVAARAGKVRGGDPGSRYVAMSGTSMAAPHVAATAAVLAQRHPDWTGAQLKAALMGSAAPRAGVGGYAQGAGRVDAARAVGQDVYADLGGLSAGRFEWPHDDDQPVDRFVTYRNAGPAPVTLALELSALDPAGNPAPHGMYALSASSVAVAAGGTATVTVRVAPSADGPDGYYTGRVTATASRVRVTTSVVADKEPESYTLNLLHLDRGGLPAASYNSFVYGIDQRRYRVFSGADGRAAVRLRKGTYHLDATVYTARNGGTESDVARVIRPVVELTADTAVVLDARAARPVAVTFDRAGVEPAAVGLGYLRLTGAGGALITGLLTGSFDDVYTAQLGPPVADDRLIADIGGMWLVPGPRGDPARATSTYHLQWFDYGALPAGFARHVVDDHLARTEVRYRTQVAGSMGVRQWIGRESTVGYGAGYGTGLRLPVTRTEFHNVDGLTWRGHFRQYRIVGGDRVDDTELIGADVAHEPGGRYAEEWNTAVFGPGLAGPNPWGLRAADRIDVRIPLFSDAAVDRVGFSEVDSGRTALYRGDELVGEHAAAGFGAFDVGPGEASYRLETEAVRSELSRLSIRTSTVWTFRSGHIDGWQPLPLLAVRFAPPGLDDNNAAPGGQPVEVPVTVQRQPGAPPGAPDRLTAEASYDDGRGWQRLTATGSGGRYTVTVPQPSGAKFVSLRATATDTAGNTVTQTVIRAYGL